MFYSKCRRFLVKTVDKSEWEFFCRDDGKGQCYVKNYIDFMTDPANAHTHLPRFFGFYKLTFELHSVLHCTMFVSGCVFG